MGLSMQQGDVQAPCYEPGIFLFLVLASLIPLAPSTHGMHYLVTPNTFQRTRSSIWWMTHPSRLGIALTPHVILLGTPPAPFNHQLSPFMHPTDSAHAHASL